MPMPSQSRPIYVNASNGQNLYGQTQERIEYSFVSKTAKGKVQKKHKKTKKC